MNASIDLLRAAVDGASSSTSSTPSPGNSIPDFNAAIMHSPSKAKTLGVVG